MRTVLLSVLLLVGCHNQICSWPADTASDASPVGCTAMAQYSLCQITSNNTEMCGNACGETAYALSCYEAMPPTKQNCASLNVPTPAGVTVYCCLCGD